MVYGNTNESVAQLLEDYAKDLRNGKDLMRVLDDVALDVDKLLDELLEEIDP